MKRLYNLVLVTMLDYYCRLVLPPWCVVGRSINEQGMNSEPMFPYGPERHHVSCKNSGILGVNTRVDTLPAHVYRGRIAL